MASTQSGVDLSGNTGPSAISAEIATRTLAFIAVILRFVARRIGGSKYWWDDWAVLASAAIMVPGTVIEILETSLGTGRHISYIIQTSPENLVALSKASQTYIYADQLVYAPIIALIKLSILFLYVRLFGIQKKFAYACYFQMVLVAIWAIVTEFIFVFQCSPIWVAWNPTRSGGTCFQFARLFIGTNTVNVIMDFAILVTPLYSIWTLQLSIQKKLLISGVLILGGAESIFSLIRVVKLSALTFSDPTWDDETALVWSTVEADVGILCACIPIMAPLLPQRWLGRNGQSKLRDAEYANSGAYGKKGSTGMALSHIRRKDSNRFEWQDDEHKLVEQDPMTIRRTTEFTVHESSNKSLTPMENSQTGLYDGRAR
ncbi:hypothetical protein MMC11_008603 [Xylographa trunciseda]|nr:hypothetical protein [Xylographa trunciseda]